MACLAAPRPSADLEVLGKIYNALGTPQDEGWGGLRAMPGFVEFQASGRLKVRWRACFCVSHCAACISSPMEQLAWGVVVQMQEAANLPTLALFADLLI